MTVELAEEVIAAAGQRAAELDDMAWPTGATDQFNRSFLDWPGDAEIADLSQCGETGSGGAAGD